MHSVFFQLKILAVFVIVFFKADIKNTFLCNNLQERQISIESSEMISWTDTATTAKWVTLLNKYQPYLSERFVSRTNLSESQKKTSDIIKQKVSSNVSEPTRELILKGLVSLGLNENVPNAYTGFIEDSIVFKIMIGAMADDSKDIRNDVFNYFLAYGRKDMIQRYSESIKKHLLQSDYKNNILLVGLLSLTKQEKDTILLQETVPDIVKAKLGDKGMEEKIISEFQQAATYKDKYEAAQKLGYIGSETCAKALLEGLNSELILKAAYEQVSIKYIIIKNLGRIHPENLLYTTEINKIFNLGDERYGGENAVREYLNKIADWGAKTYKIKLDINTVNPVIYKRIMVERILPN